MKKLLSFVIISIIAFSGFSQNIELLDDHGEILTNSYDTIHDFSGSSELISDVIVKNNSDQTLTLKASKTYIDVVDETNNYYCWNVCFDSTVYISPTQIALDPGAETDGFSAHYRPEGTTGTTIIKYAFFDVDDPNIKAEYTVVFSTDPNLEVNNHYESNTKIKAYPNPAKVYVNIDYQLPSNVNSSTIKVYNMLGILVLEKEIRNSSGSIILNTENLKNGIYFYSVEIDNQLYGTKKLLIR